MALTVAKRSSNEQLRRDRRRALKVLAEAYGEQIDDIGRMLVQAGILKAREVRRQGVRFALRDRLQRQPTA